MIIEQATSWLSWLAEHPVITWLFIFLIAFGESLAIIGLIIPGVFFMLAFGALIATEHLSFWPTVMAAVLGAIAGDGLSYWLGYRYKQHLVALWPFSKYPQLLQRGKDYFDKHGGKSVLLGRFIGPLRPVIPAVAGMVNMPMQRFVLTNVISALAWAPLVLLPGIIFGLSMEMASEFAGRFTVLIIGILLSAWLLFWLIQQSYLWLVPYTDAIVFRIINWSQRHPFAGRLPDGILNPAHPEIRVLSLLAMLLILAAFLFVSSTQFLDDLQFVINLNSFVYNGFQELHNPPFDRVMRGINHLADDYLLLLLTLITVICLAVLHRTLAIWHILAAFSFPFLLLHLLGLAFSLPIGMHELPEAVSSDGHITTAVSVYGFLAILLARELPARYRFLIYIFMAFTLLCIAVSQLYLGIYWLTDIIGGLSLGLIWFAVLGIAYRQHVHTAVLKQSALLSILLSLFLGMLVYPLSQPQIPHVSKNPAQTFMMGQQAWFESGWQTIPAYRNDLRGKQVFPLNIQWAGEAQSITQIMQQLGWSRYHASQNSWTAWFKTDSKLDTLPVLPHIHNGIYDSLRYVKYDPASQSVRVIRLWPAHILIQDGLQQQNQSQPLWYGNISSAQTVSTLGLTYLRSDRQFDRILEELQNEYKRGVDKQSLTKRNRKPNTPGWNGQLLLISNQNP